MTKQQLFDTMPGDFPDFRDEYDKTSLSRSWAKLLFLQYFIHISNYLSLLWKIYKL